jgi:N-acetylglucosamine kinase-like BadF-type ATPase
MYFTVIRSDQNTANNAITSSERQAQQVINQANKTTGAVPAGVTNLVNCLAAAGANTDQIQACQAKFKP